MKTHLSDAEYAACLERTQAVTRRDVALVAREAVQAIILAERWRILHELAPLLEHEYTGQVRRIEAVVENRPC